MSVFGDALRRALDVAAMSYSEFAEVVGCDTTSVGHWVAGDYHPSEDLMPKVLEIFPHLPRPRNLRPKRSDGPAPQGAVEWHGTRSGPCPSGGAHQWWTSRGRAVRVCDLCPCVEVRS